MGESRNRKRIIREGENNVEAHSRITFAGERCTGCGGKGVVLAMRSLATVEDLKAKAPDVLGALWSAGKRPFQPHTSFGTALMMIIREVFACRRCAPTLEKASAKHPSWIHVDVARPPKPDRALVTVPRGAKS